MHSSTTLFLDASAMAQLVHRIGLQQCIQAMSTRIQQEFLRWNSFEKSVRMAFHSQDGVIELMPITNGKTFSIKYVNGHPRNTDVGLPTVMAFGLLSDVATGAPRLICELTLLTAIRTAAMSTLAAKHLARPESRTMALIGNGAQGEFQALAFWDSLGIRRLRVFDSDVMATAKLVSNLKNIDLEIQAASSAAEAAAGADIITTITAAKERAAIITPDMLTPGMHLNAVGGDCPGKTELHPEVLQRSRVFVEYEPQSRVEGDVQQMPADFPVTEIWEVLAGRKIGRDSPEQITIFDSVGFALEDYAAMAYVLEAAFQWGIGQGVDLVAQTEDPKNLFELINPLAQSRNGHSCVKAPREDSAFSLPA